ncbi:IQ domain-containing protein IQM5-like [Triticum dicoccoides]|uniref:IQ domain-containing protein IQM5-like n=1 Tax=Triticum dicoccoides TaxID=85692 RepID=UPI00189084B5|nr:IQ domain-containing protein IQM5-like [Triticum dicoccoides]
MLQRSKTTEASHTEETIDLRQTMGLSISYPPDDYLPADDDNSDRLFVRSLSLDNLGSLETPDSPPEISDAVSSTKPARKGSLNARRKEGPPLHVDTTKPRASPKPDTECCTHKHNHSLPKYGANYLPPNSPVVGMVSLQHQAAAVRVQKVYKSFRTRRQLADCAVLVEQRWWKLLDFALLKQSSVSFFEEEKPETALSRWSRARIKAAKVGKGLSKDEKAQKLALQHWLEAIDPRHRYGHNLHYYYKSWLHCDSQQPFFYWLDVGEGKEINLEDHCPRWKLLQQCIRYLGPKEREFYEVKIENKIMMYKLSCKIVDTSEGPKDAKWIFVLSTTKILYIGTKSKGTFQHSSFLAGGATSAAGRLVVVNGILKAVWPHSGHYRPTEANFREFMKYLRKRNVDLTDVKLSPTEGEEDEWLRSCLSQMDLTTEISTPKKQGDTRAQLPRGDKKKIKPAVPAAPPSTSGEAGAASPGMKRSSSGTRLQRKRPPRLTVNKNRLDKGAAEQDAGTFGDRLDFCKANLFTGRSAEGGEGGEEPAVPQERIMHRINSKMAHNSYQLGQQLSLRWTTGAGPRIGCVRDYPPELQFRSLEQVSLSPRAGAGPPRLGATPRQRSPCTPSPLGAPGTPAAPLLQHGAA